LTRRMVIQLAIVAAIALVAGAVMGVGYMGLPAMLFGIGRYTVKAELPETGGLYRTGNVTYRGTEVGRVESVHLTDTGVEATLSLNSKYQIPSDLDAQVHSQSAVGEQYITLLPRNDTSRPLRDGDVIPRSRTSVPPDINSLLDAANRGLQAIPQDNLKTMIDEADTAIGGLGPEISRIVQGSTALALDARTNLDALTTVIDQSGPLMDSQSQTADSVRGWAAHLATISGQFQAQNPAVAGILTNAPPAIDEAQKLVERLQPTLPILLANLVSLGHVALVYQQSLEQLLVLLPQGIALMQGITVANNNTDHPAVYLDFNLNINLAHSCTTGFLPAQEIRPPTFQDAPNRVKEDVYCRIPQDSRNDVRGGRNYPCITRPGKRAPTVKLCESDENYVPLNDGEAWKGDPNATLSGQGVPQGPPGQPWSDRQPVPHNPATPPIAAAWYDPANGSYIGPDGRVYTQSELGQGRQQRTWQDMLTAPMKN
jgi:phospholipid/cholesterol/gamma-HCH transport system substrate-binding protein